MIFYWLNLLGVAVVAVCGTLVAGHIGLDIFGVTGMMTVPFGGQLPSLHLPT